MSSLIATAETNDHHCRTHGIVYYILQPALLSDSTHISQNIGMQKLDRDAEYN